MMKNQDYTFINFDDIAKIVEFRKIYFTNMFFCDII